MRQQEKPIKPISIGAFMVQTQAYSAHWGGYQVGIHNYKRGEVLQKN